MRISLERAETCLKLLLEGMSIRSVQRVTGLHQETILNLITLAGQRCEKLMRERIKGIAVKDVEADEVWGFVQCKNRHKLHKQITDPKRGDAYTFVGIERNTKLILAWHLGERGIEDTEAFTEKLNDATSGYFQLQAEERLKAGASYQNLDLVFATAEGQPLIRLNVVQKHFKPILRRAKLPETLRLYDLRHACATLLLSANENPKVVSERLGHASITLTMDTYSHVQPDMQQGASDKLERLLFAETGT